MRRVAKMLEWLLRGALMGGFISIVSGYVEYVLIRMHNTYVGNLTAGYWDIMIPYALFGLIAGAVIAVLATCVGVGSGAVRHHRYKFVRHLRGPQQGLEEFYDLPRDPLERINLAPQAQTQLAAWRTELDLFAKLAAQANLLVEHQQVDKLDKDMVKALRSLGYLQ